MGKLNLKYIFLVNAILAVLFGLGFMILPKPIMTMIGFSDGADGPTAMRFFGILVFGVGIIAFGIRNEEHSPVRQTILLGFCSNYTLMTLYHFIFCDLTNLMLWSLIVLHSVFAAIYGYFFVIHMKK